MQPKHRDEIRQDGIDIWMPNRHFSYSEKEAGSNDISLHLVEFSNVHNTDRSSNATQSSLVYKNV